MEVPKTEQEGESIVHAMSMLFGGITLLSAGLGAPVRTVAESPFDSPLKIQHVSLKPDPLNPQAKRDVSCFIYPQFVVKQVDFGEEGAERLSTIPAVPGKTPPCRLTKEQNEYDIVEEDSWCGYFDGVKLGYAFFSACDGSNGGLGFMVLRVSDKKKLLEDSARFEKDVKQPFYTLEIKEGTLKLRYQRVFASKCSVVTGGAACRDAIVKETGVASKSLSSCADGYQAAKEELAKLRCDAQSAQYAACVDKELKASLADKDWDDDPTVIQYKVEVSLGSAAPVFKRLSDVLACRPQD